MCCILPKRGKTIKKISCCRNYDNSSIGSNCKLNRVNSENCLPMWLDSFLLHKIDKLMCIAGVVQSGEVL